MLERRAPLGLLLAGGLALTALPCAAADPVPYPKGYRQWTHVKSMVIQPGHALYEAFGGIHHLYANRRSTSMRENSSPVSMSTRPNRLKLGRW